MKTYKVPHTDLIVSRLALGCALLSADRSAADYLDQIGELVMTAHQCGITLFDLADVYSDGRAELAMGRLLNKAPGLRKDIVVQSKAGDRFSDGHSIDNSAEHILATVEGSLKRLGTDYLDILLLHWPDNLVQPEEVAIAFDKLWSSGKVRHFGVSNHNPWQIELLRRVLTRPLVINQIQLGLAHWYTTPDRFKGPLTHGFEGAATLDYCRVHDIQVQAYSPLKARTVGDRPCNLLMPGSEASAEVEAASQLLASIAKQRRVVPAAIMLAWLLRHPAGIVPIIGATQSHHVIENCAADGVDLSRAEWYSLLHAASAAQSSRDR